MRALKRCGRDEVIAASSNAGDGGAGGSLHGMYEIRFGGLKHITLMIRQHDTTVALVSGVVAPHFCVTVAPLLRLVRHPVNERHYG